MGRIPVTRHTGRDPSGRGSCLGILAQGDMWCLGLLAGPGCAGVAAGPSERRRHPRRPDGRPARGERGCVGAGAWCERGRPPDGGGESFRDRRSGLTSAGVLRLASRCTPLP